MIGENLKVGRQVHGMVFYPDAIPYQHPKPKKIYYKYRKGIHLHSFFVTLNYTLHFKVFKVQTVDSNRST